MKYLYTAISFCFFLFAAASIVNGQTSIYHDSFIPGQTRWGNYDDTSTNAKLQDGKYVFTHKQTSYSYIGTGTELTFDPSRDYGIETSVSHVSGNDQYPYGLVFGASDVSNLYYFAISGTGYYTLGEYQAGVYKSIINWTASSAVRTGSNVVNKLRVEKSGSQLKLLINDQEVNQIPMITPLGNAIGVIVFNQQTVSFDYLDATYLNNTTPVNNVVNAEIKEMLYHTDFAADDQNNWLANRSDSASATLSNGMLRVARTAKNWYTGLLSSPNLKVDMHRNFLLETEAVHNSGVQSYGFGLDFGADDSRQYHFWVAATGYYYIGYTDASGFNTVVTFTANDAVNKGDGARNKLSIEHKDGQLLFFVNGQQVDSHPDIDFTGYRFGVSVTQAQDVSFDYLTLGYLDKPAPVVNHDTLSVPQIFITSPEVTRGLKVVQNSDVLHVAGVAKDPAGILSVVINGVEATVDSQGNFTADVPMAIGDNPLLVVAMNMSMRKANYIFHVVRNSISQTEQSKVSQVASEGKYYALLIGEQNYQDSNIPSLEGPVSDAEKLDTALVNHYTFDPADVTLLKDPTRAQFFMALDALSKKVTSKDNLVIFYAGHGLYDENYQQGYWFPSDAIRSRRDTWISNSDLIDYLKAIKSMHTLLISDACFSGSIFRSRSIDLAPKDIQQLYNLPSRKAMTSGAMKEVPDKSVFMEYLVKRLGQNTDKFLPSEQLFASFRAAVINNSPNGQVPQFGEISQAGDEGGDFIFIRKN